MRYEFYNKKVLVFSCKSEEEKNRYQCEHGRNLTLKTIGKEFTLPKEINSCGNFNRPLPDNDDYRAPYRFATSGNGAEMVYF